MKVSHSSQMLPHPLPHKRPHTACFKGVMHLWRKSEHWRRSRHPKCCSWHVRKRSWWPKLSAWQHGPIQGSSKAVPMCVSQSGVCLHHYLNRSYNVLLHLVKYWVSHSSLALLAVFLSPQSLRLTHKTKKHSATEIHRYPPGSNMKKSKSVHLQWVILGKLLGQRAQLSSSIFATAPYGCNLPGHILYLAIFGCDTSWINNSVRH